MSPACSQIDGERVAARFQVLQSSDVRICEIVHMNVVAKAGPVRGRVVGPVDLQLGSVLSRGGQRQWNKVSLRLVELANLAALIGSRSVEIAQNN